MTEVIEKTENKKGYKKTKLGWIPEDWDVIKLGSIIEESTLKSSVENQLPVLTSSRRGLMYQTDYYNEQNVIFNKSNIGFNILPKGYITYRSRSDDGFFTFNLNKLADGIVSIYYPVFKTKLNDYFICSLLNISSKILYKYAIGSSQKVLAISDLSKISYGIPKIEEQEKIAEILSAWDDGIETLEKLIEQKKILKNSLAQKYFHRKNNLFQLKQHKLGELFKNRKDTNCCDLELLSVCDGLGIVPRSQLNAKDNSNEDKSKYLKVCVGDLAYNTMRMWQGRCGVSSYEGIVSPAYTVCIPKDNIDVDYMYYLFKTPHMIHDFWRYSQGIVDDTLNPKFNNFEVIKVWIPDKETQTKIAKLLKSYDEEIQILNSKLEKLKEQEKGLMQKLLTGQIRVKV